MEEFGLTRAEAVEVAINAETRGESVKLIRYKGNVEYRSL